MKTSVPRTFLTIQEFSDSIGISRATTYRRIREGDLKSKLFGSRRLIPAAEVERLVSEAS